MKFTVNWLKDYLETSKSIAEISEHLNLLGLEVEEIIDWPTLLNGFKVGLILETKTHPNADRLKICKVDCGDEVLQVICGAPNAREGLKCVFASVGTTIPGTNLHLKKSKIRGAVSNGMLCSEKELCLSDDHEGIIELDDTSKVGDDVTSYLNLNDQVFEIAITPNRQDCLGVRGIARDLAAKQVGILKQRQKVSVSPKFVSPISVKLSFDKELQRCPLFLGRYIRGVKNRPSPDWLQRRLSLIGLRPISNLVDITNFFTFDQARPLHVFDADKILGNIFVRVSKKDEEIYALDEKLYNLNSSTTVIADEEKVLALAGIIGGKNTGCAIDTKNIFLEAALFDPVQTAKSGRFYNIESDARYRFERGVDPNAVFEGIEEATKMIIEMCGGEASELVVAGEVPKWKRNIDFDYKIVKRLTGVDLSEEDAQNILQRLGFECTKKTNKLLISVPSWRMDIDGEADLVEEIIRVYGYEKIPVISLNQSINESTAVLSESMKRKNLVRRLLAAQGLNECVTWSFMKKETAYFFGACEGELTLINPISADLNFMRPSILPNLMVAAEKNVARGFSSIALFELGPQYLSSEIDGQENVAACLRYGSRRSRNWRELNSNYDMYDIKADVISVLEALGISQDTLEIKQGGFSWYHPGKSAIINNRNKIPIAVFGEMHPLITKELKADGCFFGAEIYLDRIIFSKKRTGFNKGPLQISDFQSVSRDFSFLVKKNVLAQDIISAIRNANKLLIEEVLVFDIFLEGDFDKEYKSISLSVKLQPKDGTLTDSEIENVCIKILESVNTKTGAELRT